MNIILSRGHINLSNKFSKGLSHLHSQKNTLNKFHKFLFSQKVKLDPFLILEVNRNADWKTIKLSYFKLARLYHPDLNKNDEVIKHSPIPYINLVESA